MRLVAIVAFAMPLFVRAMPVAASLSDIEKRVAELGCTRCHGTKGVSSDPATPNLAGQKYDYLLRQISVFRRTYVADRDRVPFSKRAHPEMSHMSRLMTPDEMKDVARYYSLLPCGQGATVSPPGAAAPTGVDRCEICHGGMRSNPWRDTPYLAGQSETYLYETMRDLVDALQTPDAPHERYHRLAEFMFEGDSDETLRAYAAYYAHLSCPPR